MKAFEIASRLRRALSPLVSAGVGCTGARYGRSDCPGIIESVSRVVEDKIFSVGGSAVLYKMGIRTKHR